IFVLSITMIPSFAENNMIVLVMKNLSENGGYNNKHYNIFLYFLMKHQSVHFSKYVHVIRFPNGNEHTGEL
ncbi:hypothetical protein LLG96_01600, partial [bacterium]|nr:hypothetical protein [bacterium]